MPLTSVALVLQSKLPNRGPDIVALILSDFLLPDLTLTQACQLAPVGCTSLLDLVWLRGLRDAKCSKWTAAKLLQTEPHYNRWAFSQAMLQAVRRGDLVMVQWLLTHFSGCPVASEVVEEAARGGNLWVLQLLEADKTHGGIQWSERSVDEAARSANWELVRWLLRRTGSARESTRADDDVVNCAFEQNNLEEVKWAIERGFGVRSITFPDCVKAQWQGRAQILRYLLDGGHVPVANIGGIAAYRAARFGDLDFIKWLASMYKDMIDVQYWVHAAENASEGGHLSVVQWVFMNVGGVIRGNGPAVAMFAAAENGKVTVVEWLYKQYGGKLNIELFQELHIPSDDEDAGMVPTTAMDAAARNGHLCVLKYLNGIDAVARNKQKKRAGKSKRTQDRQAGHFPRCTSFAMDAAAACGHLNVVKWLHSHRTEGCTTAAMDRAAGNGHLDVVQWLHSHRSERCTTAAMDNAAARRFHVVSCEGLDTDRCCLHLTPTSFHEKQLEMIQWLHLNRTEGCTTAAMDGAAANGNLTMMQWLRDNTAAGCSSRSMLSAARLGRLDIVKWLQQNYAEVWTLKAMPKAATHGHLSMVKWLCKNQGEGYAHKAIEKAASRGHLHVVRWLLPHGTNPDALLSALKLAHSGEHFEVMLFLDASLGRHYDDEALREMRCQWFRYHDIQCWFDERHPPPSEHADSS